MKVLLLAAICAVAVASPLNIFDNIFRNNLHRILDGFEKDISYRKDLHDQFFERIGALRKEVDSTEGQNLAEVRQNINKLAKDLTEAKKKRPTNNYAALSVKEELYQIFVDIKKILATHEGIKAIRSYANSLEASHSVVFLIKGFVAYSDDATLKEMFQDMLSGINYYSDYADVNDLGRLFKRAKELVDTPEGYEVVKNYVVNLQPENEIVKRIHGFILMAEDDIIKEVLDALFSGLAYAAPASYGVKEDLHAIFADIKAIVSTPEGLNAIKDYATSLEASDPIVFLVKAFIEGSDDDTLKAMLQDMFAGINYYSTYASVGDLKDLFRRAKAIVDTNEGLAAFKDYVKKLQPSHPIVQRIKEAVETSPDSRIREVLDALFSGLSYYAAAPTYGAKEDLLDIFGKIKTIVSTQEGLNAIKDYATSLEASDPILFLVKAFIEGADDDTLKAMLQDMFAGINYYSTYAGVEDLKDLFRRAKAIVDTPEGLAAFKDYVNKLQPSHPIVQRIKEAVQTSPDSRIKEVLDALFSGLSYYSYAAYDADQELNDIFVQIKAIVQTQEGLDALKEYAKKLDDSDSHVFLVKSFIEGADDVTLREMLNDMFAGINYYVAFANVQDLGNLFKRAKAIIDTDEGLEVLKQYVKELQPKHPIVQRIKAAVLGATDERIRQILGALFGGLNYYAASYDASSELQQIFAQIKAIVGTQEGLDAVKEYASSLNSDDSVVFLVQAFIQGSDDATLREILGDMFAGINYYAAVEDLSGLFKRAKEIVDTNEGLAAFKQYVDKLQPKHPIVQRIKTAIQGSTDERIRQVLDSLFSGLNFYYAPYDASQELQSIFAQIKTIVSTQEGLDAVKEYAGSLNSDDSVVFLVQAFIQGSDDNTLREILQDMFAGINYYYYAGVEDLAGLFKRAKDIVDTNEGLAAFKQYVDKLQPKQPIVQRIKAAIQSATDERIRQVLDSLFSGLSFYSGIY